MKGTKERMLSRVNSRCTAPREEKSTKQEDAEQDCGLVQGVQRAPTAQGKIRLWAVGRARPLWTFFFFYK